VSTSPSSAPKRRSCSGVVDAFEAAGLRCFGPRRAPSQLEGSKAFTEEFLRRHGIPTAGYATFTRANFDPDWVRRQRTPIVVKASGLAAGKGVVIAASADEAIATARACSRGVSVAPATKW
jgi:phosphoribosylamine--glycine ligase